MDYSAWGIHELQPCPDEFLLRLKPQVMVHAGAWTNEPAENIQKHRARIQHLLNLLPGTLIGVRWWLDDDVLLRLATIYFGGRLRPDLWWRDPAITAGIAQLYADIFFPLHVPDSVLMVGNEDAQNKHDPLVFERTVALHTAVAKLATLAGIPCALCCTPMGTPEYGQYESLVPLFRAMQEGRAAGVVHYWRVNTYFPVPLDDNLIFHLTERSEREGRAVAAAAGIEFPPMFYGEIGTVKTLAETGEGQIGTGVSVEAFAAALRGSGIQVPSVIYCYGDGINGSGWEKFNIGRDSNYMARLPSLAPRTPFTAYEQWKGEQVPEYVNMREAACPTTSPVRKLNTGEIVQTYWKNNIGYQGKNSQWEQFCIKVMGGVRWLCRLMDISEYLAHRQSVYALFEDEAMTKPGGAWCPEICEVGKVYPRDVWVQEFWRDGTTIPKGAPNSKTGRAVTYFKVVKVHPTWKTPEGVEVKNVAECVYSFDYHAVVAANAERSAGILERYFYSGGLVAFIDYHPNGIKTHLTPPPYPAALPAQIEIPWWKPVIAEPAPPAGENPYDARVSEPSGVKLRPQPGTASGNLYNPPRVLPVGALVTLYEAPVVQANGYDWIRCESALGNGFVALRPTNGKAYFERVVDTPPLPVRELFRLPVPYYSQLDPVYAKGYRNDCGTASGKGVVDFVYVEEKKLLPPTLISVDDMSDDTDLKRVDDGLGVGELVTLLKGYGVAAEARSLLTPARLIEQVRARRKPVIVLCTTKPLDAIYANEDVCHFITVIGLIGTDDDHITGFIIHDPYRLGGGVWVTTENLVAAMTQVTRCSALGIQQGVVLT